MVLFPGDPPDMPISDRGYVQACLRLANDTSDIEGGTVGMFDPAPDADLIDCYLTIMQFEEQSSSPVAHEDFARVFRQQAKDLRKLVQQALEETLKSIPAARHRWRTRIDVMLDGVTVTTELHLLRSGRLVHLHRYAPRDNEAALALLWAFLLDPDQPLGEEVRVCGLDSCSRFFLAEKNPGGGRRRVYCSDNHSYEADKLRAAARNAKLRKRRKKD